MCFHFLKNKRTISNADISALESIANLCPNAYGQAVHQARSVLFNMTKKQYMNSCEFPVNTGKFRMAAPATNTEPDVAVYPNPAINELFVEAKAYEQVSIRLYNMMGALLLEETLTKSRSMNIGQLPSGIYVYKIYGKGIELKIGKLIISK